MSKSRFRRPVGFLQLLVLLSVAVTVGLVASGGCPVRQRPTAAAPTDGSDSPTFVPHNQGVQGRPIPPIPVDEGGDGVGGQPGANATGSDRGGVPNVPDEPDQGSDAPDPAQSLRVSIFDPLTDVEVRRDEAVAIEYRVGGETQNIELLYDLAGGPSEVVAQSNLNVEGTVAFSSPDAGVYSLSIRATGADGAEIERVPGTVTVVGDLIVVFSKPSQNRVIRPNVPAAVAYTINTLAASVRSDVFVDPDVNANGDETRVFTSTLKNVSTNLSTQGLELGVDYTIYTIATDSVGQVTGRISAPATFRIAAVPTIDVTAPSGTQTIDAGDAVHVEFAGRDSEGVATISILVDTDNDLGNGGADMVAEGLPITATSFDVDTRSFIAGTYFFGAAVLDPFSGDVLSVDYAPGTRTIPGISITLPTSDQTVRTPGTVELRWNATYPAGIFPTHEVVFALDNDNDGVPDGPLQAARSGFSPGNNTYQFGTIGLKGRYLLGVRLIDTNDREIVNFAAGDAIVLNDPPTVVINEPNGFLAVRPGERAARIAMNFVISDAENQTGLLDIDVLVARDDNADGVPDGDPVLTESDPSFRIGQNAHFVFDATRIEAAGLIQGAEHNGYGWFLLGVRVRDDADQEMTAWVAGGLYVDNVAPTIALNQPSEQLVIKDRVGELTVEMGVTDTSPTAARLVLDLDLNPDNPFDGYVLVDWTPFAANQTQQFVIDLSTVPSGYFFYHVEVTDLAGLTAHFLPEGVSDPPLAKALWVRDRLLGRIDVSSLRDHPDGAILQGVNFNDLGGSSMERVPDLDDDGDDEFVIVSRYGKPFIINNSIGVGFGEAFLIYGNGGDNRTNDPRRLRGAQTLNAVGGGSIKGLAYPGIRIPLNATAETTGMTEGISDVTVVGDMDGDELPEIVFSFPRVESINVGEVNTTIQHPELLPDIPGMGNLEYNAFYDEVWHPNEAQFTRGGIVIVSSHNSSMTDETVLNRKSDRVIDLHEIGQMFSGFGNAMAPPTLIPFIDSVELRDFDLDGDGMVDEGTGEGCWDCLPGVTGDCDGTPDNPNETAYKSWALIWDVVFDSQGPGGFHMPWSSPDGDPPLVNGIPFEFDLDTIYPPNPPPEAICADLNMDGTPDGCAWVNEWKVWGCPRPFPCSVITCIPSWNAGGLSVWSGFYGPQVSIRDQNVGARVLGQRREDRFGTAVGADGTWLYVSAPRHTATRNDVPLMVEDERAASGVVYQYRVDTRASGSAPTRSQLWLEPGLAPCFPPPPIVWPLIDHEICRIDTTMPVPHTYIIESVGSTRGNPPGNINYDFEPTPEQCLTAFESGIGGANNEAIFGCYPAPVGTASYYMDRTPQIVGPHVGAGISFVRGVGDVNDDGIEDFAVGSDKVRQDFDDPQNPTGAIVGGIFIVFSRSTGLEGDYLLEDLARHPGDPRRLGGVYLKGVPEDGQSIARVFDGAGDFNGDGIDDVVVGSENGSLGKGEAIVLFGSRTLLSPEGGYTLERIVDEARAVRFIGVAGGDLTGANVAAAGDVDLDGKGDILIAAPGANPDGDPNGPPGVVYLIYGSDRYQSGGLVDLSQVGTAELPGVVFVGARGGDAMGGGSVTLTVNPADPDGNPAAPTKAFSCGVAALGDIDGDGRADYAISSILADPNGKTNAGEIYILYGRGDRPIYAP